MTILDIAQICHEANRALCETQGDYSQPSWEQAPTWQRNSAIEGVVFNLEKPETDAKASHENWLAKKVADGWKYAIRKNVERKEHPCCIPYKDLPVEQQAKDHLFQGIVRALSPYCT